MNLYNILSFLTIYLRVGLSLNNNDVRITGRGLDEIGACSVGMQFFVEVNNSGVEDYEAEVTPNECCLLMNRNEKLDCSSLDVVGGTVGVVPKGSTKVFKLVSPVLEPYGRVGYCSVFLDSTIAGQKRITRDKYTIKFDTTVKSDTKIQNRTGVRKCKHIDEDPLDNCKPVHCDTFYNGKKPFYNSETKRCVRVPTCIAIDGMKNIFVIYNAESNKCTRNKRIEASDIEYFKGGHNNKAYRNVVVLKKKPTKPAKTPCDKALAECEECKDKCKAKKKKKPVKKKKVLDKTKKKIISCGWSFWLILVISIQCCLICVMVYLLTCRFKSWKRSKNDVNAYYSYNNDPSITTPLITTTSNMDTHTTDYRYSSPTSSLDSKAKQYKTVQDQKLDNIKKSMSDDILSKCINRRNWIRKMDASQENVPNNNTTYVERSVQDVIERQNEETQYQVLSKRFNDSRVNFEFESKKPKKTVTVVSSFKSKTSLNDQNRNRQSNSSKHNSSNSDKMEHLMSEKELKCTSYSYTSKQNITGFKPSTQKKNFGFIKTERFDNAGSSENYAFPNTHSNNTNLRIEQSRVETKGQNSNDHKPELSKSDSKTEHRIPFIEKSAQAYFSNDSIDDFLSERGMKFLNGDDISKYTFSSESIPFNESSISNAISNKTSKNNIVKKVLSLIHRPKAGPSSDPGRIAAKKSEPDYDIEVLHMSNASLYSSSNDQSNYTVNKSTDTGSKT